MAVLSFCDSARGRVGAGEELIGMAWALFVAGVPTTVASQWSVPSKSTAQLIVALLRKSVVDWILWIAKSESYEVTSSRVHQQDKNRSFERAISSELGPIDPDGPVAKWLAWPQCRTDLLDPFRNGVVRSRVEELSEYRHILI